MGFSTLLSLLHLYNCNRIWTLRLHSHASVRKSNLCAWRYIHNCKWLISVFNVNATCPLKSPTCAHRYQCSGGRQTADQLYMISLRSWKEDQTASFFCFCNYSIAGTAATSDVQVQERSQQQWNRGVKGLNEYLYSRTFLWHYSHIRYLGNCFKQFVSINWFP